MDYKFSKRIDNAIRLFLESVETSEYDLNYIYSEKTRDNYRKKIENLTSSIIDNLDRKFENVEIVLHLRDTDDPTAFKLLFTNLLIIFYEIVLYRMLENNSEKRLIISASKTIERELNRINLGEDEKVGFQYASYINEFENISNDIINNELSSVFVSLNSKYLDTHRKSANKLLAIFLYIALNSIILNVESNLLIKNLEKFVVDLENTLDKKRDEIIVELGNKTNHQTS